MLTKEQIKTIHHLIRERIDTSYLPDLCNQAILAIQLQAELDRLKAERRWVPVSERLPEECQDTLSFHRDNIMELTTVMVCRKTEHGVIVRQANRMIHKPCGIPYLDKLVTEGWIWSNGPGIVIGWQSLPDAPKAGEL